ncbi:MAG TPA: cytochrome c oxidase subunit II [Solirubrobacteraceae bacterium]|jgi:cytochrome c oxidase subunit 2
MRNSLHAYEHVRSIYFPIGIGVFALITLALLGLLIAGARRRRAGGRTEATRFEAVYALALACVVAFLLAVTYKAETPLDTVAAHPLLRIHVTAAQWSWRLEYPNGRNVASVSSWRPPVAEVPVGEEVEFWGSSRDVIHGFYIPRLRFQRQFLPGYVTRFDMTFGQPGFYGGACSVYCGEQHAFMHFELRAVPRAQFESWLRSGAPAESSAAGSRA